MATDFVASIRWDDGFACPSGASCALLGQGREFFFSGLADSGSASLQEVTSVKKGTVFENSVIPLDKWFADLWLPVNRKNGVSSYEAGRGHLPKGRLVRPTATPVGSLGRTFEK